MVENFSFLYIEVLNKLLLSWISLTNFLTNTKWWLVYLNINKIFMNQHGGKYMLQILKYGNFDTSIKALWYLSNFSHIEIMVFPGIFV